MGESHAKREGRGEEGRGGSSVEKLRSHLLHIFALVCRQTRMPMCCSTGKLAGIANLAADAKTSEPNEGGRRNTSRKGFGGGVWVKRRSERNNRGNDASA